MIVGGGQERGLRSGTLPTQLCIGFGEACALASAEMAKEASRVVALRDRLMHHLIEELDGVHINGTLAHRLPGNLNVSFAGIDAEALLMKIRDELSISSGSACSAHSVEPSHVIQALGVNTERAEGAVRIGIGRFTSIEDIDRAAQILTRAVCEMRLIYRSSSKEAFQEVAIQ